MTMPANPYPEMETDANSALGHESSAAETKARLRRLAEAGKERLTEWKGSFEDGVRERPIQSLLIAAAVGAALGLLIGRRSR